MRCAKPMIHDSWRVKDGRPSKTATTGLGTSVDVEEAVGECCEINSSDTFRIHRDQIKDNQPYFGVRRPCFLNQRPSSLSMTIALQFAHRDWRVSLDPRWENKFYKISRLSETAPLSQLRNHLTRQIRQIRSLGQSTWAKDEYLSANRKSR